LMRDPQLRGVACDGGAANDGEAEISNATKTDRNCMTLFITCLLPVKEHLGQRPATFGSWRTLLETPSLDAAVSPASLTSGFENVWSPKLPDIAAFEINRLCVPKDAGATMLSTTAWS